KFKYETASPAAPCEQMGRFSRIIFDIAAQTHDKIIDSACVGIFPQIPHIFQNGLARYALAILLYQMAQKFRLHQRELYSVGFGAKLQRVEIERFSFKRK